MGLGLGLGSGLGLGLGLGLGPALPASSEKHRSSCSCSFITFFWNRKSCADTGEMWGRCGGDVGEISGRPEPEAEAGPEP